MKPLFAAITISLLTACSPAESSAEPNPEVIAKLQEIVELREVIAETETLKIELGKGDLLNSAFIDLAEARINLASELGDYPEVVRQLEGIIKLRKELIRREELLAEENRRTHEMLGSFRIDLLNAEIRLLRTKEKHAIK